MVLFAIEETQPLVKPAGCGHLACKVATSVPLARAHAGPAATALQPLVDGLHPEVYSTEVKKTEILMENFRRAIGLRIKETKEVWEGEVTEITPEEVEDPHGGYGKVVNSVVVSLKTTMDKSS